MSFRTGLRAAPIIFMLFFKALYAQTIIPPGTISADTTWDLAGSPFVVSCGGVTVASGETLTIEPGVVVRFSSGCFNGSLSIDGQLVAEGTSAQPILFTSFTDD